MVDDLFARPHRRHIKDLNIVPILDMLTTVIFFLLMSTGFMEYTKLTLPPSQTSVVTQTKSEAPPLSPKLVLAGTGTGDDLRMVLTWVGEKPGERDQLFAGADLKEPRARRKALLEAGQKLVEKFSFDNPKEKTIQLGMGGKIPYQDLISVMDGVREKMPDVVLISHYEAEARVKGTLSSTNPVPSAAGAPEAKAGK